MEGQYFLPWCWCHKEAWHTGNKFQSQRLKSYGLLVKKYLCDPVPSYEPCLCPAWRWLKHMLRGGPSLRWPIGMCQELLGQGSARALVLTAYIWVWCVSLHLVGLRLPSPDFKCFPLRADSLPCLCFIHTWGKICPSVEAGILHQLPQREHCGLDCGLHPHAVGDGESHVGFCSLLSLAVKSPFTVSVPGQGGDMAQIWVCAWGQCLATHSPCVPWSGRGLAFTFEHSGSSEFG